MAQGLSEDQVNAEMNKMVSFIQQEALEKANEINARAQEEFSIEKGNLVQQEKLKINANYEKKMKQVDVQRKIEQSTKLNAMRLRVLAARNKVLEEASKEARNRLTSLTASADQYKTLLADLILQGLYTLMENEASVIVRKADANLAQSVLADVARRYEAATKKKITVKMSNETLPADSFGGVILSANGDRIRSNNTLDARLDLVIEGLLPELRTMLFGANASRTHYN